MSLEKARAHLARFGMDNRILEFDTSSATVELAAQAVGCEPARIAKTLSFLVEDHCVLIVAAGDARIDNGKFKAFFHTKARMPAADQVRRGRHAVGGVWPLCSEPSVTVYLDQSLRRFDTVYPACGSANSAIELTLDELERCSASLAWIDVCKGWDA